MTERETRTGWRQYRSRNEAEQLAADFEASGLTRVEFCKRNEVSLHTLARYLQQYRRRGAGTEGSQPWVAVEIAASGGLCSELSVLLAGGRRIDVRPGFDAATLQQLVSTLERVG